MPINVVKTIVQGLEIATLGEEMLTWDIGRLEGEIKEVKVKMKRFGYGLWEVKYLRMLQAERSIRLAMIEKELLY